MASVDSATPMMSQYLEIKKDHEDVFLGFRMGDFFEFFFCSVLIKTDRDFGASGFFESCRMETKHSRPLTELSKLNAGSMKWKLSIAEKSFLRMLWNTVGHNFR